MPIDASIALQSRPAQMEDPLTQYGKALSLKQLMQQGQMQDQQMREQNAVRQILRESQGNITPEVLGKIRQVSPAAAFTFEKSLRENQKAGQEFEKGEQDLDEGDLKIRAQKVSRLASLAGSIKDEATKDQAIGTALREGLLDPETATKIMAQPYETIKPQLAQFQQEAMTAAQQMEEEHRAATAKRQTEQDAATADFRKKDLAIRQQQADTAAKPNTPAELALLAEDQKVPAEDREAARRAMAALERHAKASRPEKPDKVNTAFELWLAQNPGKSIEDYLKLTRPEKPPSEGERAGFKFYKRAQDAVQELDKIEGAIRGKGLGGQAWLKWAPNFLQTQEGQLYDQAQRQFTEARLRKESGAAIANSEYENDKKAFFVQPGDTQQTVDRKRKARAVVIDGLKGDAGRAYKETYGEPERDGLGGAPKKGDTKVFPNKTKGVFDGTDWVKEKRE